MDSWVDNDLMLAAGQGDRNAFGILVERHHRAIVQFAYRFVATPDRNAAEELAQDVFLATSMNGEQPQPSAQKDPGQTLYAESFDALPGDSAGARYLAILQETGN